MLSQGVLERIRTETRAARAKASTLGELLFLSYHSYFDVLASVDEAMEFIDRNQHHIRSQLYPSSAITGLTADLAEDLRRFVRPECMSRRDRVLMSSVIIAAGAEAVFQAGRNPRMMKYLRESLPGLLLHGLDNWRR